MLKIKKYYLLVFVLLMPSFAFAADEGILGGGNTIATMFASATTSFKAFILFFETLCFALGCWLVFMGLLKLKEHSDSGGKVRIVTPIAYFFLGAALTIVPTFLSLFEQSVYSKDVSGANGRINLFAEIPPEGLPPGTAEALTGVLIFFKLLGFIAFIRGMMMFKTLSAGGQIKFGQALTHVIGGILAFNIQPTVGLLARTFFMSGTLPLGIENW